MADEVRQYTALIPAGTAAAAPIVVPFTMPARIVRRMEITVPPGPSGVVGFAIQAGGARVIPYDSDAWIVTANERIIWDLSDYPTSGAWSLIGYNTGTVDHAVYVRFLIDIPQKQTTVLPTLVPADQLQWDGADVAPADISSDGGS